MQATATVAYEFLKGNLYLVLFAVLVAVTLPLVVPGFVKRLRIHLALRKIPCFPKQHFLLGHAPDMLEDMAACTVRNSNYVFKNKLKVLKIVLGPLMSQLTCCHPETLKIAYGSDPKADDIYDPILPWLGRGLLVANGNRWLRARRLLTPAFHYDILRPYVNIYAEAAEELIGLWKRVPQEESVDITSYMNLLTLDIMLRCTCSFRSNCQLTKSHASYVEAVNELSRLFNKRVISVHQYFDLVYYCCPDYWKFRKYCKVAHKFSMDIIQKRRAELKEAKKSGQAAPKRKYLDFIDILLEAKDENGVGMTDLEIRAEIDTFMFEGHDTTASGLTWTLYNLAIHPEHQEICRREVDAIFEKKDKIEQEDLKSLTHLKYCIKESLRIFPPVPATGRVLNSRTVIDGRMIPDGTTLVANIYTVHHHPEFWENPEEFDPLRFTPERSRGRHSHAFVPFSAGPRNCIGQEFAMNEEKVVLAHIYRNFEISLDETKPAVEMDLLIILRPKNGLYLKLKHRQL